MLRLGRSLALATAMLVGLWVGGTMAADLILHSAPPGPKGLAEYILMASDLFLSALGGYLAAYLFHFWVWDCLFKEILQRRHDSHKEK